MNKKGEKHSSKNLRKKINIELKATPKVSPNQNQQERRADVILGVPEIK